MKEQPHLRVTDIYKQRSAGRSKTNQVLNGVSFDLWPGEIVVLLGPSGGGKSTLLRLLNRLEDPDRGTISLRGEDIQTLDPLQVRRQIAMVSQKPYLFNGSVADNLMMGSSCRQETPPTNDDLLKALNACHLDPALLDQDARRLSIGQQQRVCLARALSGGGELLLLDEPTSALDPPTAKRFIETFRQLSREVGLSQVIVTHDLRLAADVADRVVFLENGRVLESGPAGVVLRQPQTSELKQFLDSEEVEQ
jgi:putative ABC transport system ATP-binding protein